MYDPFGGPLLGDPEWLKDFRRVTEGLLDCARKIVEFSGRGGLTVALTHQTFWVLFREVETLLRRVGDEKQRGVGGASQGRSMDALTAYETALKWVTRSTLGIAYGDDPPLFDPPFDIDDYAAWAGAMVPTSEDVATLELIARYAGRAAEGVGPKTLPRPFTPQEERDEWVYDQYVNHREVTAEMIAKGTRREGWKSVGPTAVTQCVDRHHRETLRRTDLPPRRDA